MTESFYYGLSDEVPPPPAMAPQAFVPIRDPFAFPAGRAAGYDSAHVAASPLMRVSAIGGGSSGGMLSLYQAGQITKTGTITSANTLAGPAILISSGLSFNSFPGAFLEPSTPIGMTAAAIVTPSVSNPNGGVIFLNGSGLGTDVFGILLTSLQVDIFTNGIITATGITLSLGVPYFIGVSIYNVGTALKKHCAVTNLLTGAINTFTTTTAAEAVLSPISAQWVAGCMTSSSGYYAGAYIHSVMYSAGALTPNQMLAWAADPWSFWYPKLDDDIFSINAGITTSTNYLPMAPSAMLPFRDQIAFPVGRSAGFNQDHPASAGMTPVNSFSAVPISGVMKSVLLPSSPGGTAMTQTFYGALGPILSLNNNYVYSSGFGSILYTSGTIAGIATFTLTSTAGLCGNSKIELDVATSGIPQITIVGSGNRQFSNITLIANVPYFIAMSFNSTFSICVAMNLNTCQIQYQISTGITPTAATNGNMALFGGYFYNMYGNVAATMFSPAFLTLPQLQAWATDPWSFWYPKLDDDIFNTTAGLISINPPVMSPQTFTPIRDPFAFPAGRAPGFDPTHPAAPAPRFSAIPGAGGEVINLLNGSPSVAYSTPTTVVTGAGPAINCAAGYNTYANPFTDSITAFTMAGIVTPIATVSQGNIFSEGSSVSGARNALLLNNLVLSFYNQGVAISSGITLTVGVPYFIAISGKTGVQSYVVTNLLTGQIQTAGSTNVLTTETNTSTWYIGGNGSTAGKSNIHTVMYSVAFMSNAALLAWATDPWSFWYPKLDDDIFSTAAGNLIIPAGTQNINNDSNIHSLNYLFW